MSTGDLSIHRSYGKVFLTYKERNILIRWATHLYPVRRASDISDSSNTTRGLLFRKWFYPLYLLCTPQDIFFLLFLPMHFFKVRKITLVKSGNMNPGWPNTMFQAKWHRFKVANSYSEYLLLTPSERLYYVNETTVRILTFHLTQAHYSNILNVTEIIFMWINNMRFYGAEYNNIERGECRVQYCCALLHTTSYWSSSSVVIVLLHTALFYS
jgi:hypothetical protein